MRYHHFHTVEKEGQVLRTLPAIITINPEANNGKR